MPAEAVCDGFILGNDRHGPLTFKFKPLSVEERHQLLCSVRRHTAERLKERIAAWDLAQPISVEAIYRLPEPLFERLRKILLGEEASDEIEKPEIIEEGNCNGKGHHRGRAKPNWLHLWRFRFV